MASTVAAPTAFQYWSCDRRSDAGDRSTLEGLSSARGLVGEVGGTGEVEGSMVLERMRMRVVLGGGGGNGKGGKGWSYKG